MSVRLLYRYDDPLVVVEELDRSAPYDHAVLSEADMRRLEGISHPERRKEFLSMRHFLHRHGLQITGYRKNGAPLCPAGHLSISHCDHYGAFILSKQFQVGIDIQSPSPVIDRIARRFVHANDVSPLDDANRALWSIKEAVFKAMLTESVEFKDDIRVERNHVEFNHSSRKYLLSLEVEEVNGLIIAFNNAAPRPVQG